MNANLSSRAINALASAPPAIQRAFLKQLNFLIRNLHYPSLHAKKFDGGAGLWQARVNDDWRFYFSIERRGVWMEVPALAWGPRRELVPGVRMTGLECSFGVSDIDAAQAAIEKLGGRIVMPKVTIPSVGTLIFFQGPEGNPAGAMQYDKAAV
jgi:hypothetical protein